MLSKKLITAAFVGLLASGSSHALLSFSQSVVPGANIYSDDNAEMVLKWDGTLNEGAGGYRALAAGDTVGVNDIFIGMVGITSFPTGAGGVSASLYNEVTAVYAVQALTELALAGIACGNGAITTCTGYDFGAATLAGADPLNDALALSNLLYGTNFVTNFANLTEFSFATVLEDPAQNYTRDGTLAASSASASDGTQLFVFDLDLANGDNFSAVGPADLADLTVVPAGQNVGGLSGATTISYQNVSGWDFAPLVAFSGNIRAPGPNSDWQIWSDTTFQFDAQPVPEPGTLALLGLGLAAFGASRGFSRKQSV